VPTADATTGEGAEVTGSDVHQDDVVSVLPGITTAVAETYRPQSEFSSILRIIATTVLTAACYFTIGMQIAVVPGFVHLTLHYGATLAGLAVSVQYVATLASRPFAGRTSDASGPKRASASGLFGCAASGLLFILAGVLRHSPAASLSALLLGRFVLGFGESWVATGSALWGIARLGEGYEAKVISWNGIGSYGAVAAGAPIGVWLENHYGIGAVGVAGLVVAAVALLWTVAIPDVPASPAKLLAFGKVLKKVYPDGLGLALGAVGFGTIAAFIALYYASRNWTGASLLLTMFGVAFVVARLLFSGTINKWGGYRVGIVSLTIECSGLIVMWLGATPLAAKIGATVAGFGFSLIFPALGVEAVRKVSPENRGSALAVYTAFIDLSMGISGPIAGAIASRAGYPPIFLFAAVAAAASIALLAKLNAASQTPCVATLAA
jgi:MFS family permease